MLFEEAKTGVRVLPVRAKSPFAKVLRDREPENRLREESDHSLDARDARTDTNVIVALWDC